MLVAVIILGLVVLVLGALLLVNTQKSQGKDTTLLLKADLTALNEQVGKLQGQVSESLSKNQTAMLGALQKQSSDSNKIIADITRNITELKEQNKQVVDVAEGLKTLQNVLQNPKQRGGVGEYYLETVLGNVLPEGVYERQYKFKDGEVVDAIIKLDKGRIIPIDSKFSLENYNRMIESKNKLEREGLAKVFKADLKGRIDETSKYIRPNEGTLDYAFMFIPSEAIYYDLLVNDVGGTGTNSRDLIEYAFVQKKVIIVSPTTLLAYLQTVMQGLRSLQIEEKAKDIQKRVGELGKHIKSHDVYMQKLGNTLGTTVNHFNAAHKSLKAIDTDVVKIADIAPSVEALQIDKPVVDED